MRELVLPFWRVELRPLGLAANTFTNRVISPSPNNIFLYLLLLFFKLGEVACAHEYRSLWRPIKRPDPLALELKWSGTV